MTFHQLKDTWDLEVFFKGGSGSAEFRQYLNEIKTLLSTFKRSAEALTVSKSGLDELKETLALFKQLMLKSAKQTLLSDVSKPRTPRI